MAESHKPASSARRERKAAPTSRSSLGGSFTQPTFFVLSVLSAFAMFYYHRTYYFLPSIISTKCPVPEVVNRSGDVQSSTMFWGTYRANVYIGMTGRSPVAPLFGAMWFWQPAKERVIVPAIRHWCKQQDGLQKYAWVEHDGRNYGIQEIVDGSLGIRAVMLKRHLAQGVTDWTWRISTVVSDPAQLDRPYSFIFYLVQPERSTLVMLDSDPGSFTIGGQAPGGIGKYQFRIASSESAVHSSVLRLPAIDSGLIDEEVAKNLIVYQSETSDFRVIGLDTSKSDAPAGFVAIQLTLVGNNTFELAFQSAVDQRPNGAVPLLGKDFDRLLVAHRQAFDQKFEQTFGLKEKQYADVFVNVAKHALSNMLATVSYFHGVAIVQSTYNKEPVLYGPLELFSTIPSRPFFPRGFLWDEGFHQLLLRQWDSKLSLEIVGHWLDLMNVEGWIPREVILGTEALRKVPWEFVVQRNTVANPPVFFYVLNAVLNDNALDSDDRALLKRMYPRLKLWYLWLNQTQSGAQPGTYRWHGRNASTQLELNPKTLPSGLDDYPRASHPSDEEYHLDLYCWMAVSADCMRRLSHLVGGEDQSTKQYSEAAQFLRNADLLDRLYWSNRTKRFCDYGLHTKSVSLEPFTVVQNDPRAADSVTEWRRVVKGKPVGRLVSDVFGYVSLFPLFLRILQVDSPKLLHILDQLTDPDLLWSPFGLRSLAKSSVFYDKRNTEHDPPYWRGSVWINMNHLALSSLHYYSQQQGPYREQIFKVYSDLRNAVVGNVVKQYLRTGYLWEHYNDVTGAGEGSHPFTGWTSLVVLMMAEKYE